MVCGPPPKQLRLLHTTVFHGCDEIKIRLWAILATLFLKYDLQVLNSQRRYWYLFNASSEYAPDMLGRI